MSEAMEGLRTRVREVIRHSGHRQREFATEVGLEPSKLSKSLQGTRRFTAEELIRIADVGGVTVNWLLNGHDDAATVAASPRNASATPTPVSVSGDREAKEQSRRRQIIEAAWQLIAERGYHSVRVSDIARACGTSTATIHYHFPTLHDLLNETLRSSVKQAFDRQVAVLHQIDDVHERLLRLIELQLPAPGRLSLEWSIWLQVWTESTLRPEMRSLHSDSYQRWHETIARTLDDGRKAGVFRDLDPDETAVRLSALVDGLGIQVLTGRAGRSVDQMRTVLHDFIAREVLLP